MIETNTYVSSVLMILAFFNLFQTTLKFLLIKCIADSLSLKNWWSTVYTDEHIEQILWFFFFLKGEQCKPGVVACICSCYLGGWGIKDHLLPKLLD